jgi:hypothetical protein
VIDAGDDAVVHVGDGVGEVEDAVVVADDEDGAVRVDGGGGEEFHDTVTGFVVEGGGGFVADDETGLVDEGSGEGDALLLTSGETGWGLVETVAETELVEDGGGLFEGVAAFHGGGEERDGDIFCDGESGDEVVLLEDEADVLAPEPDGVVRGHGGEVAAEEGDGA